jgi:hypothetical protein
MLHKLMLVPRPAPHPRPREHLHLELVASRVKDACWEAISGQKGQSISGMKAVGSEVRQGGDQWAEGSIHQRDEGRGIRGETGRIAGG